MAFKPGGIPFPVLHVDTGHNFPEVLAYRDAQVQAEGARLIVARVQDSIDQGRVADPGPGGSRNRLQTTTLLDAINAHGFDAAFGGARRDEDKARAKERVLSFRDSFGQWDPKNQRPELWNIFNSRINKGESIRVFPLSNWTEADVWFYIYLEKIPIVPLYFAKEHNVVIRGGSIVVAYDKWDLLPGEKTQRMVVRMRSLGCVPCTGAIVSTADTVPKIIEEMISFRRSERENRVIDHDEEGSMEIKKREGYF
jgi:sulfate adenylyltransferase subunit 2